MNSMFDFITHNKGIEYILSLTLIAGIVPFMAGLKSKPVQKVKETGQEDPAYIKRNGVKNALKLACKIVAAPFVGLLFVILLPVVLLSALSYALFSGVVGKYIFFLETGRILPLRSFGWRPTEAYLGGKNKKKDDSDKAGRSPTAK